MQGTEFLKIVERSMPSRVALVEYGLSDEEIDDIQRTFLCLPREADQTPHRKASELERMIVENNCSALEIAHLRFLDQPRAYPDGVAVALWEADPVVVLRTGSVVAFDHSDPAAAPTPCAGDSETFLDALAFLVEASANKPTWTGRATEAADRCADKAGGEEYRRFFGALCSFLG